MQVLTINKKLYTLKDTQIQYSKLFQDIECTVIDKPIDILVTSKIFEIILDFMNIEQNVYNDEDHKIIVTKKQRCFFRTYDIDTVISVCSAANYLCYPFLLEVSANVVADYFKNKDINELKALFGNNLNESDKRNISKEYDWIPDKNKH